MAKSARGVEAEFLTQVHAIAKTQAAWYNLVAMIPKAARNWLAAIGRKGGSATTKAKAAAARKNGRRGGRPRKKKA